MAASLARFCRNISTQKALRGSLAEPLKPSSASAEHHDSWRMWRTMFFVACCPAILISFINVQLEEHKHPPEFIPYSHLRIRNKKYPWRDGVKTLFHNPHFNPLPTGYETV